MAQYLCQKALLRMCKISVYQNGYALYEISGLATVFPIWDCQNYRYEMEENEISEQWFEKEAWYLRLILEGEDRINPKSGNKATEKEHFL